MDLIKVNNGKYEKYEELLLERDQVKKEAGQIWTAYQKVFGKLITDVFKAKVECIKRKKMIAYYQRVMNRGLAIDQDEMKNWLDKELLEYQHTLTEMLADFKRASESGRCSPYEVQRSKQLYRRIAKLIHPDINPETDRHEELIDLWNRALIGYGRNDVKELSEIEVLVRKALSDLGADSKKVEIPDLVKKIEELEEEIKLIKSTKPYTYLLLVEDKESTEKEKEKLVKELTDYKEYAKQLDAAITEILAEGKVSIKWRMN